MSDKKYMEDHRGNLVPIENVKTIDLLRDELVNAMVIEARGLSNMIQRFKIDAMKSIMAFVEQSAREYDVIYGGHKGNIQLLSFDGKYKVQKSVSEYIVFDERLQVAKKLIDECIISWTVDTKSEIKSLINNAFEVDKQGKINRDRILGLRRLDITDEKWQRAMSAIADSIQVTGSKEYIRIYERQADGSYRQIPLDIAAICIDQN